MSNRYEGLSAGEADDLMQGLIGCTVCEALNEARRMTKQEMNDRDIFEWSHYVAGLIMVIIQNRRRDVP
ncbi:hypothetical protein JUM41_19930 [Rhizobium pusense]|uniref:hypothetical protein n=1 Tax=Agrobacterium pusense TaxID=648995 RepID=UPI001FCE2B35|nr:hypothetical protein [Agrobacterium pusense]MCJ2876522.1 hypothetical protein [Agrobacterium pusense]